MGALNLPAVPINLALEAASAAYSRKKFVNACRNYWTIRC